MNEAEEEVDRAELFESMKSADAPTAQPAAEEATPWEATACDADEWFGWEIKDAKGRHIASVDLCPALGGKQQEYAESICRSVNRSAAVDALVEALRVLLTEPWLLDSSRPKHWAQEQARAALAEVDRLRKGEE